MHIKRIIIFIFFSYSTSFAQNNSIEELYKQSNQIISGILVSKQEVPGFSKIMAEFNVTEIQKGKRRIKFIVHQNVPDSLIIGKEYLVFTQKKKSNNQTLHVPIVFFNVCPNCNNIEVKDLYKIIKRKPFRKVKDPLPYIIVGKGCGCS